MMSPTSPGISSMASLQPRLKSKKSVGDKMNERLGAKQRLVISATSEKTLLPLYMSLFADIMFSSFPTVLFFEAYRMDCNDAYDNPENTGIPVREIPVLAKRPTLSGNRIGF